MKLKLIICTILVLLLYAPLSIADTTFLLKGSVVKVPQTFFGTWRVKSELVETNAPYKFTKGGVDIWNISQFEDVITLSNPFTGASAQIEITDSNNDKIEFTKISKYDEMLLVDKVSITIKNDSFNGFDELKLVNLTEDKNSKAQTAKYRVKGEKTAGLLK